MGKMCKWQEAPQKKEGSAKFKRVTESGDTLEKGKRNYNRKKDQIL